jgi:hypothetical protein
MLKLLALYQFENSNHVVPNATNQFQEYVGKKYQVLYNSASVFGC